jgi:hypothetical protein
MNFYLFIYYVISKFNETTITEKIPEDLIKIKEKEFSIHYFR